MAHAAIRPYPDPALAVGPVLRKAGGDAVQSRTDPTIKPEPLAVRCGKHLSRPASRLLEDGVTSSKPGNSQAPGGGGGKLSRPIPPPRDGRRPNLR